MKKALAIILALTFVFMVGCGKGNSAEKDNSVESGVEIFTSGKIGTAEEPVVVKVLQKDGSLDIPDYAKFITTVEEGMAKQEQYIKVEIIESPSGTYAESVPLAFRTGEVNPDIIYFQNSGAGALDQPIAEEGMLEDLTPYIEASTYIKPLMQPHNIVRIKNYPYLLFLSPQRIAVPVIREDQYLQLESAAALEADPSPENYHKLFAEIVEKDFADYAITSDGSMAAFDSLFNHAFGVTTSFMNVDGNWISAKVSQGEKDKLEYYSTLYAENLIDPEYITNQWDTKEAKFYEGKAGLVMGTAGAVIQVYNDKMTQTNGDAAKLVVLPPAKGVGQSFISVDPVKEPRGFAINAYSTPEAKAAAWAMMDYIASPDGRNIDLLGFEGIQYNIVDGKTVVEAAHANWIPKWWESSYNYEPPAPYTEDPFSEARTESLKLIDEFYYEDINILIPESLLPQWDAMMSIYNEYSSDIIRGVKPIESFDEMVEKWNEAGGTELSEYLATELSE